MTVNQAISSSSVTPTALQAYIAQDHSIKELLHDLVILLKVVEKWEEVLLKAVELMGPSNDPIQEDIIMNMMQSMHEQQTEAGKQVKHVNNQVKKTNHDKKDKFSISDKPSQTNSASPSKNTKSQILLTG